MRLVGTAIKGLKAPVTGHEITYDDEIPGFGLRVTAADVRAFVLDYRIDGRKRRYTLGRWPDWTATKARAEALELRRKISAGEDPLSEREQRRKDPTFKDLTDEYLERHAPKKRSGQVDRRYLEKDVLKHWGGMKARAITRADVLKLLDAKVKKSPIAANRLLAVVRKVFNWGIERGIVESNPCLAVKAPAPETRRDRVLTADEIRIVWKGMEAAEGVSGPMKAALRLILTTSQRPGEVAAMEWREIDGSWWTIPAAKAKNGLAHRVWLSEEAKAIIDAQPREGRYVFTPRADKPAEVNAVSHAVRRLEGFGVKGWTPHDLRRTAASAMASGGVPRVVVGKILNHAETSITAVYDRYSYDAEKKKALDAWGRKLKSIVEAEQTASKVLEFPA